MGIDENTMLKLNTLRSFLSSQTVNNPTLQKLIDKLLKDENEKEAVRHDFNDATDYIEESSHPSSSSSDRSSSDEERLATSSDSDSEYDARSFSFDDSYAGGEKEEDELPEKGPRMVERIHTLIVVLKEDGREEVVGEIDLVLPLNSHFARHSGKQEVENETDDDDVLRRTLITQPLFHVNKAEVKTTTVATSETETTSWDNCEHELVEADDNTISVRLSNSRSLPCEPMFTSNIFPNNTKQTGSSSEGERIEAASTYIAVNRRMVRQNFHTLGWDANSVEVDTIEDPAEVSHEDLQLVNPPATMVRFDREKNEDGVTVRRVIWTPIPVITTRRIYRKIVRTPSGEQVEAVEKIVNIVDNQDKAEVIMTNLIAKMSES